MSYEAVLEHGDGNVSSVSLPFPKAVWGRLLYALFVTVLPALSFSSIELLKPEWQTGNLSSYVILFLFPESSIFFFPLLAYSIICYLLLLFNPTRFAQSFVVRAGIYTGILLALQYSILLILYSLDSFVSVLILTWIFPFVYWILYRRAVARWTAPRVNRFLLVLVVSVLLVGALLTKGSVPFLVLIALIMAAPFWSFLLAVQASTWLIKHYETKLTFPRAAGLTTWLTAYVAALRFDILKIYELYAALPTTPPADCYIATAAARGHPGFVGAWAVQCGDGTSMQVNAQLQRLKCMELALMAVHPCLHAFLRRIYDVIGKRLACRIQSPLLADAAYLFLKPWEGLARLVLKSVIPEIDSISVKLYK